MPLLAAKILLHKPGRWASRICHTSVALHLRASSSCLNSRVSKKRSTPFKQVNYPIIHFHLSMYYVLLFILSLKAID